MLSLALGTMFLDGINHTHVGDDMVTINRTREGDVHRQLVDRVADLPGSYQINNNKRCLIASVVRVGTNDECRCDLHRSRKLRPCHHIPVI